jgi:hypothetical protein
MGLSVLPVAALSAPESSPPTFDSPDTALQAIADRQQRQLDIEREEREAAERLERFYVAVAEHEAAERAEAERLAAERAEAERIEAERTAARQAAAQRAPQSRMSGGWAALRNCESGGNYRAVSSSGAYRGAYQFSRATWNSVAARSRPHLVGVDPAAASPADQDAMALALHASAGSSPWPKCGRHL